MSEIVKVQVQKLVDDAVIPEYKTDGSAGFDFYLSEKIVIRPGKTELAHTGIKVAVPKGYYLAVVPRSGLSLKTHLRIANAPGTVDSDYRGEVCILCHNTGDPVTGSSLFFNKGERIAQGIILPVPSVEFEVLPDLDITERGDGGFGSTGA